MINGLTPYLTFEGTCEEALNFYAKSFKGEIKSLSKVKDGPKEYHSEANNNFVMHSELKLDQASIMASDSMGRKMAPGGNTSICLNFDKMEEIESAYNNMKAGGTVTMELQDTFWGAKFGSITDKYGINWMFNCDKK